MKAPRARSYNGPQEERSAPLSSSASGYSAVEAFDFSQSGSLEQIAAIRALFLEYAESLGFSLCFQGFEQELAALPGEYSPPRGRLILATRSGDPAGCVALHGMAEGLCEMKRLYVRPEFRGSGLGRALAGRLIEEARKIGYRKMRLDTVEPRMKTAVAMYRQLGFQEIAPYRPNPIAGAVYMELDLLEGKERP
jgi:putative acetyltransferase